MKILAIILAAVLDVIPYGDAFMEQLQKRDSILIADQIRYGVVVKDLDSKTSIALPEFPESAFGDTLALVKGWQLDTLSGGRTVHSRNAKAAQPAIVFLLILSSGTVVWGLLNGAFFGINKELLPAFMRGLPCLRGEKSMMCVQWFCFAIALTHLAGARIWRAVIAGSWREALGNLGWMFFITCNFFAIITMIVGDTFPFVEHASLQSFPLWCYSGGIIGAVLILLFSVNWGSIGDVLYTPFNFINSFVDVLSYIRLFAVGLSGTYIATCFNSMGAMLYEGQTGWRLVVFGICGALVIVIGHVLNIALGAMSVLVHGLRLNTLEFSNHMQISCEGKAYKPFSEQQ